MVKNPGGRGIGMGNTCKSMAVSFQCMTKSTTKKKKRILPSTGDLQEMQVQSLGPEDPLE